MWPPAVVAIPSITVNDCYAWSSPLVFNGTSSTFAQPVFADNYLFTASRGPLGLQAYTAGG